MEKQELITSFANSSIEEVRLSFQTYKGRQYLSLWLWFKNDDDNWQPSKKGLILPLDLLSDLKKAVDAALAKIEFEESRDSVQAEKEKLRDAENFFKKAEEEGKET